MTPPIETVRAVAALRARVAAWRGAGETIGLVPTMGAVHDGHLALISAARAAVDRVVVSLFVNPAQFGPSEDLAGYPRDAVRDAALIAGAGADLMFAPDVDEVYPKGFATTVSVSRISEGLCGDDRPGHFDGVATVVAKLLNQCRPDGAWFGEKDYQQLMVIRRLAADLDLGVRIHGVETVREADGLALSSRNAYLSAQQRAIAPALHRTLCGIAAKLSDGGLRTPEQAQKGARDLVEAGFETVDYFEVRDAETLAPVDHVTRPARVLAAAWLGRARLIDNVPVIPGS